MMSTNTAAKILSALAIAALVVTAAAIVHEVSTEKRVGYASRQSVVMIESNYSA